MRMSLANPDLRFLQQHIRGLSVLAPPTGIGVNTIARADVVPSGLFDMDNEVSLALGYAPGLPEDLFLGEITGVAATFPDGGMPTMTITAHDFLQRTTRGSISRGFGPLPDAAIVAILSAENGLLPIIEPTMIPLDALNTIGNFLFGTATKQESVDHYTLYLTHFFKEYSPRLTLKYGQSLLDFSPRISTVGQAVGISKR